MTDRPKLHDVLETCLDLLEDWLGVDCEDGCDCILHELRLEVIASAPTEDSEWRLTRNG